VNPCQYVPFFRAQLLNDNFSSSSEIADDKEFMFIQTTSTEETQGKVFDELGT
jgi:hypothetical protein